MTTATASRMETRDGYAEAISALLRARKAVAQIDEAMNEISDAMARTGYVLDTWNEVLATPYGTRGIPRPAALKVGEEARYLRDEAERQRAEYDELAGLEKMLRAAISESGPSPKYEKELDALCASDDA